MDPVTLHVNIDRPREEVFAYLADVANHPEFTDHFLKSWRLTREESEGRGAGARYRQDGRFDRFGYYDLNLAELDPPYRIVAVGRGGKYNRIKTFHQWTLEPDAERHAAGVRLRDRAAAARPTASSRRSAAAAAGSAATPARRCGGCRASSRRTAIAARARRSAG